MGFISSTPCLGLARFVRATSLSQDARDRGWKVLGAAGERGAVDSASVTVTAPTILVVGKTKPSTGAWRVLNMPELWCHAMYS